MQWEKICDLPKRYTPSSGPRLLLTGANGLLGQAVLRAETEAPTHWTLIASGKGPPRALSHTVPYVSVDATDATAFGNAISTLSPAYVLHAAAMTQVDDCEKKKEEAYTCNLLPLETLLSAVDTDCFVLLLSTDFVFDGTKNPYDESERPAPCNYYGHTKLLAEQLLQASAQPWAVVRTSMVYGMGESLNRVPLLGRVRRALKQGQKLQMVNDQWRRPTFVDDLAAACLCILQKKQPGIFHITGEEELTPYEMTRRAASYWGYDKTLIQLTDTATLAQLAPRPRRTLLDIEKAKLLLNYTPSRFLQGLRILDKYQEFSQVS